MKVIYRDVKMPGRNVSISNLVKRTDNIAASVVVNE